MPLRPLSDFLVTPANEFNTSPNMAHLLVLRERLSTPRVSHRDPDGQLVLEPNVYPGPIAGWVMHLPYEKNPLPGNLESGKSHWSTRAAAVRSVRDPARVLALHTIPPQARIRVRLDWHTVIRRTRDEDNLVPCMKALVDGLRLALVVPDDDKRFVVREMPEILYAPKTRDNPRAYMRLHIQPEPV